MSADNGIYILQTKDGFRVTETQAIDNLYWWGVCCSNSMVLYDVDEFFNICLNCKKVDVESEIRNKINPYVLKEYFGHCKVFKSEKEAHDEACRLYNEIMDNDCCPIVEYGIQSIDEWKNKDFPK